MDRHCSTRLLKNARFLQSEEVGFLPKEEPLEGFPSLVPFRILRRLEHLPVEEITIEPLARVISHRRPPRAGPKPAAPLFSGTLRFVSLTISAGGSDFTVPDADLSVATKYASLAAVPISEYASQYGPTRLTVADAAIPFTASVREGRYNDRILAGWTDQLARSGGLGPDSCLMFLNPLGVVNTDADATQGVLGYHNASSSGVPYIFVNVMGRGLTIDDRQDVYAVALSHEIAEMDVDPLADGRNPEVSDPCAGNCGKDYRNYFDPGGSWLGGTPTTGYLFFIDGIAKPESVGHCPAPVSSCSYPPPKDAASRGPGP